MVYLKGLTASILVNGRPLTEYPDEDTDDLSLSSKTNYIESQVGKEFAFQFTWDGSVLDGCLGIACEILVDGIAIQSPLIFPGQVQPRTCVGPKVCTKGVWTEKALVFANVQTTEESSTAEKLADLKKAVDKLGLLTVLVQRVSSRVLSSVQAQEKPVELQSRNVPEKALKGRAVDTNAALGTPRSSCSNTFYTCTLIETRSDPYISFKWKYRSRKALQIMSVIPRSPTPEPLENRPIENLSREELVELIRRREADVSIPVKPETTKAAPGSVKRERDVELDEILASARPAGKKVRAEEVEIVDLLDD